MSDEKNAIPLQSKIKRVTIKTLHDMKKKRPEPEIICALSIYDSLHARLFDRAGGDMIIVGDSVGMTLQGRANTLPVTMDEMVMFTQAVRRGTDRLFVVGDMPLGSYEVSNEEAVRNALRFVKEAGCNAVKVETNLDYIDRIRVIASACLVVAHIGLNPNKAEMLGGYRTQGKTRESFLELSKVIVEAEKAGACIILIESVTEEIAEMLKSKVNIPVFGIAAGRKLDGQLVISSDLLGFFEWPGNPPIHFEKYLTERQGITIGDVTLDAFRWYVKAVKEKRFPSDKHVHHISADELSQVLQTNNNSSA
ncbi:MAG: 3-methyl-2-oxobutanoate hydroxymethyltransferase [Candidatus Yanofskybacteria bacterium]|nr:3-methyl-2-oxobutanoate hydroxymethyltransferase [Candidatus Yanofskybacteria bacterium]